MADRSRGLTTRLARQRLAEVGRNELPSGDRRTPLQTAWSVIREPMLLLLLAATALYVVFGDLAEAIALGVSVFAIVAISFAQEHRTERALDALRELASPHARVFRDGAWSEIDARDLVPGDLVHVGEGDRAPADALLREGSPLTIDESLLTGESVPVVRTPDPDATALHRPGETGASVFAGTLVGSGNATAEVMRTGATTEVGRIGAALGTIELARAPLHQEVANVVRRLAVIAISLCVLLVAIHLAAHHGILAASLAGITLAMSLLPEELPLVLTVFLALGAWRMTRHRVLARRAAAIETLGAVTVLCVDKTGTLTVNRMAIRRIVSGEVHDVDGRAAKLPEAAHEPVEYGLLACPRQTTDAMDRAFATLAQQTLGATEHVHPRWEWLREYPLSPGLLAVTHVWRDDARHVIVATKGAPEAIIDLCHLEANTAALWRERADAMARDGLRVLGVARARHPAGELPANPHDYEFEIVGLVGLADPLREETAQTIATCRAAGVRVIMITGDHPTTARAIARAAGLRGDELLTGPELETLDEATLAERLERAEVIARAAPAHKLRIIRALRADGHVVAMTGDGVNDAPALKAADVGVAMGHGTDVAREAAGLVILDDSLAAIEAAIRTGRTIYDNLRSVAVYLLAVHVPIAGLALLPPLFGWPLILAPLHIVLLELVVDPTCSIVFELDPPASDVMQRPPRGRSEHLFELRRVAFALVLGIAALAGPLAVIGYLQLDGAPAGHVRTLGFVALIAADLALVLAVHGRPHRRARSERNGAVRWMTLAVAAILAITIFVPPARSLFSFAVVDIGELVVAILAGVVPVLAVAFLAPKPGARRGTGMPDARLRGMRAVLLATTVLAACQTADAIETPPSKEPPPEDRFERDMLVRFHMHENVGIVRTIEKRLVHGKLDEARELARALAEAPDEPGLGPWSKHQVSVRERASELAHARTIEEACDAEARMAVACAGCHVAANVTPELRAGPQPTDDGTVQRRMARHVWATDRIWDGIIAGDDESALSGLGVLAETPLKEPTWTGDRARAARELQQRAAEARKQFSTDTQIDRAHAYARLLVTCSSCHLQVPR